MFSKDDIVKFRAEPESNWFKRMFKKKHYLYSYDRVGDNRFITHEHKLTNGEKYKVVLHNADRLVLKSLDDSSFRYYTSLYINDIFTITSFREIKREERREKLEKLKNDKI